MSDISFSKLTWENLPARTTALSAQNLNRIEKGIDDSVNDVNANAHDIAELRTEVGALRNGTPPTASSTSEMDPDESTVYINTTDGNWYYWNGSAWTSGGTYGGGGGGGEGPAPYTSNPAALGSASPGTVNQYSRGDHVHPLPPVATTSTAGLMSAQDKGRLDDLYADYSSALTALG